MTTPTTIFNFDEIVERRGTDSGKWGKYDPDVIPMWTADMDFRSPPAVIDALRERAEHGVFGYGYGWAHDATRLTDVLIDRMATRYDWQLEQEDFLFVPNIVSGLHGMCQIVGGPGDDVLVQTPNYWPFFSGIESAQQQAVMVPLVKTTEGAGMRFEVDFDALEAAITPQTHLFMLSSPHNPVGRAYERWELERMADICLRHDLIICSDEIHCDLVFDGREHITFASLGPEVAERSLTFMAPSKTFNVPGLKLGFAMSKNRDLLGKLNEFYHHAGIGTGIMGYVAAEAAYRDGQPWLTALLDYLQANRDYAFDYIVENLPGIVPNRPEATYLMWLDCCESCASEDPTTYFLERGRVALSGNFESQGCAGFTRLNFGCPRSQLTEALERMRAAMA